MVLQGSRQTHHFVCREDVSLACLALSEEFSLLLNPDPEAIVLLSGDDAMAMFFFESYELIIPYHLQRARERV